METFRRNFEKNLMTFGKNLAKLEKGTEVVEKFNEIKKENLQKFF